MSPHPTAGKKDTFIRHPHPARTPKRVKRKQQALQAMLTEFAIAIGLPQLPNGKCDTQRYNRSWLKLWKRIHQLKLFPPVSGA